jgi:carboxyl-terminal processing protease
VRGKLLDGNLGYVRISSFSATSGADTAATMKSLLEQHPRGFVLDLRSNPGGYLEAAVDIASQFLGNGVVLYQQAAGGERQELRARPGGQATGLPVVVLIDCGSASASEIVAAALHDNGRAALVGEKSYGKGSVQTVHTLSDASGLRVTSAIWLTPSGQPLERQGLEPDVAVAAAADDRGEDLQLEAAVRYLEASAGGPAGPNRV